MYNNSKDLFDSEYVSYTRLSGYEKCPHLFKLKYLDQVPVESSSAAQLGTLVHAVIEDYLREIKKTKSAIETDVDSLTKRIDLIETELRDKDEITVYIDKWDVEELLEGFVDFMPIVDTTAIKSIEEEVNFYVQNYRVKAVLDLVLESKTGEYTVIDFKTGKPKYVEDFQIKLYALPLVEKPLANTVKLIYAFLRFGEVRELALTRKEFPIITQRILNKVKEIEKDKVFPPNPSGLCRYCEAREYCDHC
jgi:putative RecB family exonuclease